MVLSAVYVLADAHGYYIKRNSVTGQYVPTGSMELADRWDTRTKAGNILKSSLVPPYKKRFSVKEIEDCDIRTIHPTDPQTRETDSGYTKKVYTVPESTYYKNVTAVSSKVESILTFLSGVHDRRIELEKALSQYNLQILDIQHYMEFYALSASEGYEAYRLMRETRLKRRAVKDELALLNCFSSAETNQECIDKMKNELSRLTNRNYTPRALPELFRRGDSNAT